MFLLKRTKIYRNNQVTIPNSFIVSQNLQAGDEIEIYAGEVDGIKALIVIPLALNSNLIQSNYKNLVKDDKKQVQFQNNS